MVEPVDGRRQVELQRGIVEEVRVEITAEERQWLQDKGPLVDVLSGRLRHGEAQPERQGADGDDQSHVDRRRDIVPTTLNTNPHPHLSSCDIETRRTLLSRDVGDSGRIGALW